MVAAFGCIPPGLRPNSTLPETSAAVDSTLLEPVRQVEVQSEPGDTSRGCTPIGTLMDQAEEACDSGCFSEANELLHRAVVAVDSADEECAVPEDSAQRHYERVVELYSTCMPEAYLDSIPDRIAPLVFRRQLSHSLDSLKVSSRDSARMARLLCEKGIEYNVPMAWNDRVFAALLFYSRGRKGPVGRWLERAEYYLPFMKQMFVDSGLPSDLAYLPLIESGFNPKAYSYAHASGIWQFIPSTGRRYGLRQSYWVDERRDPIKSTVAAIRYLTKLYGDFGDWHCALAAYNCGEGRVGRALATTDTFDFWQLRLPRQTMNYVPQYISALIVAKNASCFGFDAAANPDALRFDLDTIRISECLEMKDIAEGIEVDLRELKRINPHILRWCTPPEVKDVFLYLPPGSRNRFVEFIETIPDDRKVKWYRYRICHGDNLIRIARRFKVPVSAIKSVNKLRTSRIVAGRHLFIPIPVGRGAPPVPQPSRRASKRAGDIPEAEVFREKGLKPLRYRVKSGDTVYELAKLFGVSVSDICRWNDLPRARSLRAGDTVTLYVLLDGKEGDGPGADRTAVPRSGAPKKYVVGKGDNPYSISRKLGVSLDYLLAWNSLDAGRPLIHVGDTLVYYNGSKRASGSSSKPGSSRKTYEGHGAPAVSTAKEEEASKKSRPLRYRVREGDNLSMLAALFGVSVGDLAQHNRLGHDHLIKAGDTLNIPARRSPLSSPSAPAGEVVYYTVRKGDNLWAIAQRHDIPVKHLRALNGLGRGSVLMPGDTLRIVATERL